MLCVKEYNQGGTVSEKLCGGECGIFDGLDAFEIKCYLQKIVFEELLKSKCENSVHSARARAIYMYK